MPDLSCRHCGNPVHNAKRRLCRAHYRRWQRYGDPLGGGPMQRQDRAEACVVIEDSQVCGLPTVGRDMCRKHYMRDARNDDPLVIRPRRPSQVLGPERRCTKCGETKPTGNFPWRSPRPSGRRTRHAWCSGCLARYHREHDEQNAERKAAQKRANYLANKERIDARNRAYKARNRERYRAIGRRSRMRHRAKMRRYSAEWRARNPEKVRAYALRHLYRKTLNWVEDVDRAILFERDRGYCGICGLLVDPADWHMDHVHPLSRQGEHSYANVQVSHPLCNSIKTDRLLPLPEAEITALRLAHQHLTQRF